MGRGLDQIEVPALRARDTGAPPASLTCDTALAEHSRQSVCPQMSFGSPLERVDVEHPAEDARPKLCRPLDRTRLGSRSSWPTQTADLSTRVPRWSAPYRHSRGDATADAERHPGIELLVSRLSRRGVHGTDQHVAAQGPLVDGMRWDARDRSGTQTRDRSGYRSERDGSARLLRCTGTIGRMLNGSRNC